MDEISKLTVFFGLDTWTHGNYEQYQRSYTNPLLNKIRAKHDGSRRLVDNIMSLPISDSSVDDRVAKTIGDCFKDGMKIGWGCVGAHGRTGWVYAKLLMRFEGLSPEAAFIEVRKRLCTKAIESKTQVDNLGIKDKTILKEFEKSPFLPGGGYYGYGGYGEIYDGSAARSASAFRDVGLWSKYDTEPYNYNNEPSQLAPKIPADEYDSPYLDTPKLKKNSLIFVDDDDTITQREEEAILRYQELARSGIR